MFEFAASSDSLYDAQPARAGFASRTATPAAEGGRLFSGTARAAPEIQQRAKPAAQTESGFAFRKRRERLNWRLVAALDVDRITRDLDLASLQQVMTNLTFCDVQSEDLRYVDPNFVKLFQLAQLIIEYVVFCQRQLARENRGASAELASAQATLETVAGEQRRAVAEAAELRKENRSLKKTLFAYQMMAKMSNAAPQVAADGLAAPACAFPCRYCDKAFTSSFYLSGHLARRHPGLPDYTQFREDAEAAAPPLPPQPDPSLARLADLVAQLSQHMLASERSLKAEASAVPAPADALADLKTSLHREFERERALLQEERGRIETLLRERRESRHESDPAPPRSSHVGALEDEDDATAGMTYEQVLLSKFEARQQQTLASLHDAFHRDIEALQTGMLQLNSAERAFIEAQFLKQHPLAAPTAAVAVPPAPAAVVPSTKEAEPPAKSERAAAPAQSSAPEPSVDSAAATDELQALLRLRRHRESLVQQRQPIIAAQAPRPPRRSWDQLLDLWALHHYTPVPDAPWIYALYSHPSNLIDYQRGVCTSEIDAALAARGLALADIQRGYPATQALIDQQATQLNAQQLEKTTSNALYAKMRAFLAEELDAVVRDHFRVPDALLSEFSSIGEATARKAGPAEEPAQTRASPAEIPTLQAPPPAIRATAAQPNATPAFAPLAAAAPDPRLVMAANLMRDASGGYAVQPPAPASPSKTSGFFSSLKRASLFQSRSPTRASLPSQPPQFALAPAQYALASVAQPAVAPSTSEADASAQPRPVIPAEPPVGTSTPTESQPLQTATLAAPVVTAPAAAAPAAAAPMAETFKENAAPQRLSAQELAKKPHIYVPTPFAQLAHAAAAVARRRSATEETVSTITSATETAESGPDSASESSSRASPPAADSLARAQRQPQSSTIAGSVRSRFERMRGVLSPSRFGSHKNPAGNNASSNHADAAPPPAAISSPVNAGEAYEIATAERDSVTISSIASGPSTTAESDVSDDALLEEEEEDESDASTDEDEDEDESSVDTSDASETLQSPAVSSAKTAAQLPPLPAKAAVRPALAAAGAAAAAKEPRKQSVTFAPQLVETASESDEASDSEIAATSAPQRAPATQPAVIVEDDASLDISSLSEDDELDLAIAKASVTAAAARPAAPVRPMAATATRHLYDDSDGSDDETESELLPTSVGAPVGAYARW